MEKFRTKEVRYAFAAHMLRAKIFATRALEILDEIEEENRGGDGA